MARRGGHDAEVLIVGAGLVGKLLAVRLHQLGVSCLVLERAHVPEPRLRVIGVHPPSLEILEALGLAGTLIARGIKVRRGRLMGAGREPLGALRLDHLPGRFAFTLSCPGDRIEMALEEALEERSPGVVHRGIEVLGARETGRGVELTLRTERGGFTRLGAQVLVGCDGSESTVRRAMAVGADRRRYRPSFVLGDLADHTGFGDDAALYMGRSWLVESFPLPGGQRRWVASTEALPTEGPEDRLRALVAERTGHDLDPTTSRWSYGFVPERLMAWRFYRGSMVLAGDAAHVVSPIGGQGMNLGFRDAWELGAALEAVLRRGASREAAFGAYQRRRRRSARRAARRAELLMALGLGGWWSPARDELARSLLRSPAQPLLTGLFTMRWL